MHGEERLEVKPNPGLGEHTRHVLQRWLDYDTDHIEALVAADAIGVSAHDPS